MANSNSEEAKPGLVAIRTFISEFEVIVAKSALEAAGIDCMVSRDDCGACGLRYQWRMGSGSLLDLMMLSEPKKP